MNNDHLHSRDEEPRHRETEELPSAQHILMPSELSVRVYPLKKGGMEGAERASGFQHHRGVLFPQARDTWVFI